MSRGHGRVERIVLESVHSTRYGCTVLGLAYRVFGIARLDGPSEAQLAVVERTVRRLLDEERLVERVALGSGRFLMPATPTVTRARQRRLSAGTDVANRQTLQCAACDIRWVSEEFAPHRLCWSCGEPGRPASPYVRRRARSG